MKKCPKGQYYCYDEKKCKPMPKGYHVGRGGYLAKGSKNGNGNGNGANGGITKKEMEALLAKVSSGPVQTIRVEQAPIKITTDDKSEPFKM
mgnify:CR=1 FL=1